MSDEVHIQDIYQAYADEHDVTRQEAKAILDPNIRERYDIK